METHPKTPAKFGFSRLTCFSSYLLISIIRVYQYLLSPWLGNHCRFTPSCSHYAIEAIEKYGSIKGSTLTIKRLGKCHPWHKGGYDPVPDNTVTDKKVGK